MKLPRPLQQLNVSRPQRAKSDFWKYETKSIHLKLPPILRGRLRAFRRLRKRLENRESRRRNFCRRTKFHIWLAASRLECIDLTYYQFNRSPRFSATKIRLQNSLNRRANFFYFNAQNTFRIFRTFANLVPLMTARFFRIDYFVRRIRPRSPVIDV